MTIEGNEFRSIAGPDFEGLVATSGNEAGSVWVVLDAKNPSSMLSGERKLSLEVP